MGVTSVRAIVPSLLARATDPIEGAPESRLTLRPGSAEELAEQLQACSASGLSVLVWGGGTHQAMGHRVVPDVIVAMVAFANVVDHQAEDMTLVVEGGVTLGAIDALLGPHRQMAIVPEMTPRSTIGGVVATGMSGYRRARYGPTRDHLLEVTLVTGDGRVVRGGGRVVKNVQGYDLMRLSCGSFGSLGVIVQVCLKLWPRPAVAATVAVDDADRATGVVHRPWAVIETDRRTTVHLAGTNEEIDAQAARLGGDPVPGHAWPVLPDGPVWSVRVPANCTREAIRRLPPVSFVAQHGVGVVDVATDDLTAIRPWAEAQGGSVVRVRGAADGLDPWGTPPATAALQRRIIARFDPDRVINPGRLPGGL